MFKSLWLTWKFEKFKREFAKEINYLNQHNYVDDNFDWAKSYNELKDAHSAYTNSISSWSGWFHSLFGLNESRTHLRNKLSSLKKSVKNLQTISKTLLITSPAKISSGLQSEAEALNTFRSTLENITNQKPLGELSLLAADLPGVNKNSLTDNERRYWLQNFSRVVFEVLREKIRLLDEDLLTVEKYIFQEMKNRISKIFDGFVEDFNFQKDILGPYETAKKQFRDDIPFKKQWNVPQGGTAYPKWCNFLKEKSYTFLDQSNYTFQMKSKFEDATNQELTEIWTVNNLQKFIFTMLEAPNLRQEDKSLMLELIIGELNKVIHSRNNKMVLYGLTHQSTKLPPFLPLLELPNNEAAPMLQCQL